MNVIAVTCAKLNVMKNTVYGGFCLMCEWKSEHNDHP